MKRLLLLSLSIVVLLLGADTTFACTCVPLKSAAEELEQATAVFSGKVVQIKRHKQATDILSRVEAVIVIEKAWKGVKGGTISVFTSSTSASCGYGFKEGRTYLVYAHGNNAGKVSTSICSRTRRLKDAHNDLEELGKINKEKS